MGWQNNGTDPKQYTFNYDWANRLKDAGYTDGSGFSSHTDAFKTEYTYDANGNIETLKHRYDGNLIDDLGYTYSTYTNKLESVSDVASADYKEAGYKAAPISYSYDLNGNMITDHRGVVFDYNFLNMPELATYNTNNKIRYVYTASGTKLQKSVESPTYGNKIVDYVGPFLYEDNDLKVIFTSAGRIVKIVDGSNVLWKYEYNLTDHLGNARAVFAAHSNGIPEVMQQTDYYPFGMVMNQQEKVNLEEVKNRYLYNGKELQDDNIGINLDGYDYGARFYDPAGVHWNGIDPQAEKYYSISPYAYCANNPILFVDPNGEEIWIYYNDADGNEQKMQYTQGMTYDGDNAFVSSSITALNQMNSTEIGSQVLGDLTSSENMFDFKNEMPTDKNGNPIDNALSFRANKDGGGTIRAGALMSGKMQDGQKLECTAHELFHGYQHENGQTGLVNNEIGAYLYGRSVSYTYQMNSGMGFGQMPWGNGTASGDAYEAAMNGLIWAPSFNYSQYNTAVNNFKTGSSVNTTKSGGQGLYKNFTVKPASQSPLIKKFFPLIH